MWNRGQNKEELDKSGDLLLDLQENEMLELLDCEHIYTYWAMGKRIIHSLIRFAFSAQREITISDAPTEAVDAFKKAALKYKQDEIIQRAAAYCRLYGMAGMFAAVDSDKIKDGDNLTVKDCSANKIAFNALNPLNLSGTYFNQDANSVKFMKPEKIYVAGQPVGSKRAVVIQTGEPLYLRFSDTSFTFSGVSVFQNMVRLIKAWQWAIISLERMAIKAGSIVHKEGRGGKSSGIGVTAAKKSAELLKQLRSGGVATIGQDGDVTFFPLTGVAEVDAITNNLNREIMFALDDTPAPVLLGKDISNGLAEGTEEMKAVVIAVENFRKDVLTPLYKFSDSYIMALAWTDDVVKKIAGKADAKGKKLYAKMSPTEIRQLWERSFTYEYGNLFPTPEKDEQETNGVILDNLTKAKGLGMDIGDIEEEINERKIFKNDIELNENNLTPEPEENEEVIPTHISLTEMIEAEEK